MVDGEVAKVTTVMIEPASRHAWTFSLGDCLDKNLGSVSDQGEGSRAQLDFLVQLPHVR
jgi:hypothetical protein